MSQRMYYAWILCFYKINGILYMLFRRIYLYVYYIMYPFVHVIEYHSQPIFSIFWKPGNEAMYVHVHILWLWLYQVGTFFFFPRTSFSYLKSCLFTCGCRSHMTCMWSATCWRSSLSARVRTCWRGSFLVDSTGEPNQRYLCAHTRKLWKNDMRVRRSKACMHIAHECIVELKVSFTAIGLLVHVAFVDCRISFCLKVTMCIIWICIPYLKLDGSSTCMLIIWIWIFFAKFAVCNFHGWQPLP